MMYQMSDHDCSKHQFSPIDSLANSVIGVMQCKNCYKLFTLDKVLGFIYICLEILAMLSVLLYSFSAMVLWLPFVAMVMGCLLRIYAVPLLSHQTEKRIKFRPNKK